MYFVAGKKEEKYTNTNSHLQKLDLAQNFKTISSQQLIPLKVSFLKYLLKTQHDNQKKYFSHFYSFKSSSFYFFRSNKTSSFSLSSRFQFKSILILLCTCCKSLLVAFDFGNSSLSSLFPSARLSLATLIRSFI